MKNNKYGVTMYTIEEYDNAKSKVLKYILYKKRSKQEVKNKFYNSIEEEMLNNIIDELEENGYIDDFNYVERAVNEYIALNNLSLKEVRYKLMAKGINSGLIDEYFSKYQERMQEYEVYSARNLIIKKEKQMDENTLMQFLLKKGYKSDNIRQAIERIQERKMQNIISLETNKYAIKLENFEGPLDLLCHLIDKNKMNINDISLSTITDQYIEYINKMEEMNLEVTSEFLIMASTLIYLKSKSLLPKEVDDEEEISEEELLRRIIEYKKYKEITKKLRQMYNENSVRFYKLPDTIKLPKQKLEEKYEKQAIVSAYENVVRINNEKVNQNAQNIEKIAITDKYTVASKVKDILKELVKKPKFVFNHLFSLKRCEKEEVVTAFSGLLELSRRNKVLTKQEELFGDISVEKNNDKIA